MSNIVKKKNKKIKACYVLLSVCFLSYIITFVSCAHYPGTYSFVGETGLSSTDISFVNVDNSIGNCGPSVLASVGEHDEVLALQDADAVNLADISHMFSSVQTSGFVEFYIRTTDAFEITWILLSEDTTNWDDGIRITIQNDRLRGYWGNSNSYRSINNNQWYKLRIEFDCSSGTWSFAIDGSSLITDQAMYQDTTSANLGGIRLYTGVRSGYSSYFDAFGYSWDPAYNTGGGGLPGGVDLILIIIIGVIAVSILTSAFVTVKLVKKGKKKGERLITRDPVISTPLTRSAISTPSTPSLTVFCSLCGAANDQGNTLCSKCGNSITTQEIPIRTQGESIITDDVMKKQYKRSIAMVVIGVILVSINAPILFSDFPDNVYSTPGQIALWLFAMGFASSLIGAWGAYQYKNNPEKFKAFLEKRKGRKMKKKSDDSKTTMVDSKSTGVRISSLLAFGASLTSGILMLVRPLFGAYYGYGVYVYIKAGNGDVGSLIIAFAVLMIICSLIALATAARAGRINKNLMGIGVIVALAVFILGLAGLGIASSEFSGHRWWTEAGFYGCVIPAPIALLFFLYAFIKMRKRK